MFKILFPSALFSLAFAFLACDSSTGEEAAISNGTYRSEYAPGGSGVGIDIVIKDGGSRYALFAYTKNAGIRCDYMEEAGSWEMSDNRVTTSAVNFRTRANCDQPFGEWAKFDGKTMGMRNKTSNSFEIEAVAQDGTEESHWNEFVKL